MTNLYQHGDRFEAVPVLKFIEYDKVVVLLYGVPEVAEIEDKSYLRKDVKIYHITAPSGTVADVHVVARNEHGGTIDPPILMAYKIRIRE